jgi:curved DNA-binding protein CbpA
VLGIEGAATLDLVESRFRALIKVHHPDQGGEKERETFERIVQAREAARMEIAS